MRRSEFALSPAIYCPRSLRLIIRILTGCFWRLLADTTRRVGYEAIKRALRFGVFAHPLGVLGAPLFVLLAVAIWIDSRRPYCLPAESRRAARKVIYDVQIPYYAYRHTALRLFAPHSG